MIRVRVLRDGRQMEDADLAELARQVVEGSFTLDEETGQEG